uniref:BZIP domain-containing protein n=1 Tax=Knipowitschia caucasica TaxID=637954 RepID=A0AAV2MDE2_KNICA
MPLCAFSDWVMGLCKSVASVCTGRKACCFGHAEGTDVKGHFITVHVSQIEFGELTSIGGQTRPQGLELELEGGKKEAGDQDLGKTAFQAEHSHQTVCLAAPRGNQFNSPQVLASTSRGGGRRRPKCFEWTEDVTPLQRLGNRLKAALSQHPGAIANGNMNSMGHMMEMMSSRQEQGHHHMHPHAHLQPPPHAYHHHGNHHHSPGAHHHHQGHAPHHNSHNPHMHPGHHQSSPHAPMHPSQMSPATQQMQPTQTLQSPPPGSGRRRRVMDEDPDERRRKFLERNRAAATRCRQKRKVWVMSLEKKAEELTQTNMQLQNEVTLLKSEVTQLKQLLLTHKDCPITTMQKESQGYLSPESSPASSPAPVCSQQQVIQHNTITTSTTSVGGSGVLGPPNHRTDINPCH